MALRRGLFVRKDATKGTNANDSRLALAGLLSPSAAVAAAPGVLPAPGGGLVVSGSASWSYSISPGHAVLARGGLDGAIVTTNDGTTSVSTSPAPGSGSRWDIIWMRHLDAEQGDPSSAAEFGVTSGTAATSPVKPTSLPVGALRLAEALVQAGATSTAHASVTITNVAPYTATRGAPILVRSQAERDALASLASPSSPVIVMRRDLGILEWSLGSGWTGQPSRALVQLGGLYMSSGGQALGVTRTADGVGHLSGITYNAASPFALAAGTSYQLGVVPAGYRPTTVAVLPAVASNQTPLPVAARLTVDTAGVITFVTSGAVSGLSAGAWHITSAGSWLTT